MKVKTSCSFPTMEGIGHGDVNKCQIEVFNNVVEKWWDKNGPMKSLHTMNTLRVPFIRDGLLKTFPEKASSNPKKPLENFTVAEIGCGGGILSEALAGIGCKVFGIDANEEMIELSKKHAKLDDEIDQLLNYVHSTVENSCANYPEKFDAVILSEIIEHVPNKEPFLKSCTTILKPGGSIFITTFNKTMLAWFVGIVLAENVAKCIPKHAHDVKMFISPKKIEAILKKYDCTKVSLKGMVYNVFKNTWSWDFHTQILYALHLVKNKK